MRVFDILWSHSVGKCSRIENLYTVIIDCDTDKGIVLFPVAVTKRIGPILTRTGHKRPSEAHQPQGAVPCAGPKNRLNLF